MPCVESCFVLPCLILINFPILSAASLLTGKSVIVGNVLWALLFGWWMCLIYFVVAVLMAIFIVPLPYAHLCLRMGVYFLWPFDKYVVKHGQYRGSTKVRRQLGCTGRPFTPGIVPFSPAVPRHGPR